MVAAGDRMNKKEVPDFVVIDSVYGQFIVNRYCHFQAEALIKTGHTHIESELRNIFAIMGRLPDHSVVIDGGTNIGFFTIPVGRETKSRGFKIIGFEAQKLIYYAVAGGIALNGLDNCIVYNLGLSDKAGQAELPNVNYSANFDFGTVSIRDRNVATPTNYLDDKTIRTIAIDDMNLPRVDFIKLDIEGHEPQAIRGGIHTIKKFRPLLWIEYFLVGAQKIQDCFAGVDGYEFQIMDGQNMLCAPSERLKAMGIQFDGKP